MTAEITTWLRYVGEFMYRKIRRHRHLPQEYHPAGDLHTLLLMKGSTLDVVRFYMAELVRTSSPCPSRFIDLYPPAHSSRTCSLKASRSPRYQARECIH